MSKTKVCITTIEFPPDPGGVGESVKRIGGMLAHVGYEVHVAVFHARDRCDTTLHGSEKEFDKQIQDGLVVHRYRPVVRSEDNSRQEYLSDVYGHLRRLHEEEQFDLFHAFYLNENGFLTTLLAKEVGKPVINSIRGSDLHKNVFNARVHSQVLWVLENSDWLTFVSRDLEHRAHVLVPETKGRTKAFWNSVAPIDFERFPKPVLPSALKGTVVSTFGSFRDKKGTDFLIRACAELAGEIDLTLLMVGDFKLKEKQYWEGFIRDSGMADRIVVTGMLPREQALGYLELADIYAIPSLRDGCPNSLLEAMLAGKAIIGSAVDAIGEILQHGRDGMVVRPASVEDLVTSIRVLADSPELRERLGKAARKKALTALSPEVEEANWRDLYQRLMPELPDIENTAVHS